MNTTLSALQEAADDAQAKKGPGAGGAGRGTAGGGGRSAANGTGPGRSAANGTGPGRSAANGRTANGGRR